ncbi:aminotransferase class IV [Hymenobacter bucti]|uniref:branched-chain-amino-acid transaminase n=1 Tax=Hymenobacter bucti TaxID=1844114 RepID=A0ABW4QSW5_9BACT
MSVVLFNEKLVEATQLALPLPNRGLAFGDGFFETLIFSSNQLRLADDHAARMRQATAALYLTLPAPLATAEALASTLGALVAANQLPAARLRLQVWRGGGGRYTPPTDTTEWLATAEPFVPDDSPIGVADFARETQSMYSLLSFCKGPQAWLYVRAAHERQQRGLDEIILCDAAGHVAEAGAAAVFWLKDNALYTPALTSGCVAGVRRADVLRRAAVLGMPCREGLYLAQDLVAAEAIFTANVAAVRVVQQVGNVTFGAPEPALLAGLRT